MSELPSDRTEWPKGVGGEDPRDSSAEYGDMLFEETVELIGRALERARV
jgi:creatinine amidohydrolase/Fe(II)-dependent formamide hydrolase-like protein